MKFTFSEEVSGALHFGRPVVALESTVLAHGLPYPQNIETAYRIENLIRDSGATPATIAVFDGEVCIGLGDEHFERLVTDKEIRKLSRRDLPVVLGMKASGATTVSTTAFLAHKAGIKVFATGGIGGVHRGDRTDVSADLPELARTPIIVVCSGAKIVLDLPATREWLETFGVTVLGWQCDEFPAFYSRSSGLAIDSRVIGAEDVALEGLPTQHAVRVDHIVIGRVVLSKDGTRLPSVSSTQSIWYAEDLGIVRRRLDAPSDDGLSRDVTDERLTGWSGLPG